MTELGIDGIADTRLIGHAPGASVYAATRIDADPQRVGELEQVAIKVLRRLLTSEDQQKSFHSQIAALQELRDLDGVVPILDAGITVHHEPYLVLPLHSGSSQDLIDKQGPVALDESVAIVQQAAQAIDQLHQRGVLHMGLKPSNLLLQPDGRIAIADVGISLLGGERPNGSWLEGSPVWAAPESFGTDRPTTRSDIYGLGACLLALLSGQPPFPVAGATNPLQLIDRIRSEPAPALATLAAPDHVVDAIRQAMFKDPAARPPSALAFASLLGPLAEAGQVVHAQRDRAAPARPAQQAPPVEAEAPDTQTAAILEATARTAAKHSRFDLVEAIDRCQARLAQLAPTVVVIGEHNKGKSALLNALALSQVCSVDPEHSTAVTTVLSHAHTASATMSTVSPRDGIREQSVDVAKAIEYQITPPVAEGLLTRLSIALPSDLLDAGIQLIDTAPTGSLASADTTAAALVARDAAVVLLVVDAARELTESDIELAVQLHSESTHVICIMTKIDFYPRWRDVAQRSRDHLATRCPGVELIALSSALRVEAAVRDDPSLYDESGFGRLVERLTDTGRSEASRSRTSHALDIADDAVQSMIVALDVERSAIADPAHHQALAEQSQQAQHRVDQLRSASSRWGTVLSDGISDLSSAVDLQVRTRLRAAVADIETSIDDTDPGETGDELIPEIESRFMSEVAEIQTLIESEARALAQRVAEVFDDEADIGSLAVPGGEEVFEQVTRRDVEITPAATRGASLFTGLRGSYSGIAIFGMAGGLLAPVLGAVLLGPLSLVAGAVFGRKLAVDERKRQLVARRNEARQAVRRYGDEATLHISKHCRDALQHVQRTLRDENLARASILAETAAASRDAASKALKIDRSEAEQRSNEIAASLEELRIVERAILAMQSPSATSPSATPPSATSPSAPSSGASE